MNYQSLPHVKGSTNPCLGKRAYSVVQGIPVLKRKHKSITSRVRRKKKFSGINYNSVT